MEHIVKGSVVAIQFPFSDLKSTKLRPALVMAVLERDDLILAQITSKHYSDKYAVIAQSDDFSEGSLLVTSYIRPGKLFTANASIVRSIKGVLSEGKREEVVHKLFKILEN